MSLISNIFRKLLKITLLFFPLIIGLHSILFQYPKHLQWLCSWSFLVVCFALLLRLWHSGQNGFTNLFQDHFLSIHFRRNTFFFKWMQLSRLISVEHAGWWLRGHSVSQWREGLLSQSTCSVWTPSGPAYCWMGQRSETRLLLGRPGLWVSHPDLGMYGCGFCHPSTWLLMDQPASVALKEQFHTKTLDLSETRHRKW